MKLSTSLIGAAFAVGHTLVFAGPITLDATTIQSFEMLEQSNNIDGSGQNDIDTANGDTFLASWISDISGDNYVSFGLSNQTLDWTGYSALELNIANLDTSVWSFYVSVTDANAYTATSSSLAIAAGTGDLFSVDLTGLNLSDITGIAVTAYASLPIGRYDRSAQFSVESASPQVGVPVPATFAILGLGLMGLVYSRRAHYNA